MIRDWGASVEGCSQQSSDDAAGWTHGTNGGDNDLGLGDGERTVNIRQGAPSIRSPVLRQLSTGMSMPVDAVVVGDSVQGNALWYGTAGDAFAWSGAFLPLDQGDSAGPDPQPAPPEPPPTPTGGDPNLDRVPLVVDLYHGDGVVSFHEAFAAGLRGVIHKATTGALGMDDAYARRRALATRAGLLWGAYHWGTAAPVSDQVDNFLRVADPGSNTLVALDFEQTAGDQMTLDGAREFLGLISEKLGRKAVLYSGNVAKSDLGSTRDAFFGSHRLWLAQYGPEPVLQESWSSYWLWQYTDGNVGPGRKTVPGIPGNRQNFLDCDHFPGTVEELRAQWAS